MKQFNAIPSVLIRSLLFLALIIYLTFHFVTPINLMTADVGRHIRNGEFILKSAENPLRINFYSYTMPQQPVINHHWGSGVVFYKIWQWAGFSGLSFFYLALFLAAVLFYFLAAVRLTNFPFALFFTFITIPLIADRNEIRPEGFSAFFLGVYLYLLVRWKKRDLPTKALWLIPILQIFWANLHVFFFLGIFLLAVFAVDCWLQRQEGTRLRLILAVGIVSLLACVINPFGWQLLTLPFVTFSQFGYRLAENQTPFFMITRFPHYWSVYHFLSIAGVFVVSVLMLVPQINWRKYLWSVMIAFVVLLMALKAVRCMSLFGMVFVPIAAWHFFEATRYWAAVWINQINRTLVLISGIILGVSLLSSYSPLYPFDRFDLAGRHVRNQFELISHPALYTGVMPGINAAADFYKAACIEGPIFNNYDIGGYLIFHLFPRERPFVDNRPEAYTVSFFKDIYVPMQEDESIWQKMQAQYQFSAIFFYRHDMTPWGQDFLIKRIQDHQWAPVFVDNYAIIFLKRNAKNDELIRQFELPPDMFRVTAL